MEPLSASAFRKLTRDSIKILSSSVPMSSGPLSFNCPSPARLLPGQNRRRFSSNTSTNSNTK